MPHLAVALLLVGIALFAAAHVVEDAEARIRAAPRRSAG
jgi:hypothetical protein